MRAKAVESGFGPRSSRTTSFAVIREARIAHCYVGELIGESVRCANLEDVLGAWTTFWCRRELCSNWLDKQVRQVLLIAGPRYGNVGISGNAIASRNGVLQSLILS